MNQDNNTDREKMAKRQSLKNFGVNMKKLLAIVLLLGVSIKAHALPLGNPVEPRLFDDNCCFDSPLTISQFGRGCYLEIGFYGDYVFNRHLENDVPSVIQDCEIMTNAGYLSLTICNLLDIFGTLGTTTISIHTFGDSVKVTPNLNAALQRPFQLQSPTDFSWSVGARFALIEYRCFGLGVEGQYFYSHPDLDYIHGADTALVYPGDVSMKYQEWQGGVGAYYRVNFGCPSFASLVPYFGVKCSHAKLNLDNAEISLLAPGQPIANTVRLRNCDSQKYIGYAIGLTATVCDRLSLTLEGRFCDEKAFHLNGQLRF